MNAPAKVVDPVLGEISFSNRLRAWTADVPISGRTIEFVLAGDGRAPADNVLAHASDLVRNFPAFQAMISEFLNREALEYPGNSDEVRQLQIACINLPFPNQPKEGEIGFCGPDETRVWHCCYRDGKPDCLGFDD